RQGAAHSRHRAEPRRGAPARRLVRRADASRGRRAADGGADEEAADQPRAARDRRAQEGDDGRQWPPRLYRLSARSPPLARRPGADACRSRRRGAALGRRLSRRRRLARPPPDRGLVCGDEVPPRLPPAARRTHGGDPAAGALRQGRFLGWIPRLWRARPRVRSAPRAMAVGPDAVTMAATREAGWDPPLAPSCRDRPKIRLAPP